MEHDFAYYKKSAEYVRTKIDFDPEIGIILGTGLGGLADDIENPKEIPYKEIPNFLVSTAPSHAGKLISGMISGKKVICMSGRFHYYEGYSFEQLTTSVRLFKNLGVKTVIQTNAAGAVNKEYKPGDVMIIKDHINLMGVSPTRGDNIPEFGDRFFDVSKMYTPELRKIALDCAKKSKIKVHEGVYYFFSGPQFETAAEIRAVRILGADAVGMSTVPESLTAAHCGLKLLAFSLITNMATGVLDVPAYSENINEIGNKISGPLKIYLKDILSSI